eukprot:scaffold222201_cov23-Tisochrysis_lutea.AAC.1
MAASLLPPSSYSLSTMNTTTTITITTTTTTFAPTLQPPQLRDFSQDCTLLHHPVHNAILLQPTSRIQWAWNQQPFLPGALQLKQHVRPCKANHAYTCFLHVLPAVLPAQSLVPRVACAGIQEGTSITYNLSPLCSTAASLACIALAGVHAQLHAMPTSIASTDHRAVHFAGADARGQYIKSEEFCVHVRNANLTCAARAGVHAQLQDRAQPAGVRAAGICDGVAPGARVRACKAMSLFAQKVIRRLEHSLQVNIKAYAMVSPQVRVSGPTRRCPELYERIRDRHLALYASYSSAL